MVTGLDESPEDEEELEDLLEEHADRARAAARPVAATVTRRFTWDPPLREG